MQHKPWVRAQPWADFFAVMRPGIITHDMNGRERGRNLRVQVGQKRHELPLLLACIAWAVDPSGAHVEASKEIQRPRAPILVLHPIG